MPEPSATSNQSILCVAATLGDLPAEIADDVQSTGVSISTCPDVYRAMARIGRSAPTAVIVCVDWLSTVEVEFFEILRRTKPALPVLVFASQRAQSRVEAALGAGAGGRLNQANLRVSLRLEGAPLVNRPNPESSSGRLSEKTANSAESLASTGNELDAELESRLIRTMDQQAGTPPVPAPADNIGSDDARPSDHDPAVPTELDEYDEAASPDRDLDQTADDAYPQDEADDLVDDSEENESRPIRVPWLRYDNGPKRGAPQRTRPNAPKPPRSDRVQRGMAQPSEDEDPPLLSQEELDALLGELGDDE